MAQPDNLSEGWFSPFNGRRRWAHYLKDDKWLCGVRNWVPAKGIRPLMKNTQLPHCPKCQKILEGKS